MIDLPTKPDRILCTCGAEPEAHKLKTGFKLLADTARSWGWVSGRQESNAELVGRAMHDMHKMLHHVYDEVPQIKILMDKARNK